MSPRTKARVALAYRRVLVGLLSEDMRSGVA